MCDNFLFIVILMVYKRIFYVREIDLPIVFKFIQRMRLSAPIEQAEITIPPEPSASSSSFIHSLDLLLRKVFFCISFHAEIL